MLTNWLMHKASHWTNYGATMRTGLIIGASHWQHWPPVKLNDTTIKNAPIKSIAVFEWNIKTQLWHLDTDNLTQDM